MIKKVALLYPPNHSLINTHAAPRLGLYYLSASLKKVGHNPKVFHFESLNEIKKMLYDSWDVIGISATTPEYPDAIAILNYFKRNNYPAPIMLGGAHSNVMPYEALLNGFDLVVRGEADLDISKLVENIPKKATIYNSGFVQNLDNLPFLDRDQMDVAMWKPSLCLEQDPNLLITFVLLSRGCIFKCNFCGKQFPYRRRSKENIKMELVDLKQRGYDGVIILDDLPFINENQVRDFCEIIAPLNILFRCNFRSDLLTTSIAKNLAEAGCKRLQFGVESADLTVLKNINKKSMHKKSGEAIEICHNYGIQSKAMFIWGLPGDNEKTAESMIEWVKHYRPTAIQLTKFTPLPGSYFWEHGYSSDIIDYKQLDFFPLNFSKSNNIENIKLQSKIDSLYTKILNECRLFTHIDRGEPIYKNSF
jgi:radical SAM superfamily enzyme YgiQ (UPF0313 family)